MPYHHCGYAGTETDQILDTLLNDFSDLPLNESIVYSYEDDELKGVLGLAYDQAENTAELWGPFISEKEGLDRVLSLWQQMLNQLTIKPERISGFYNIHNQLGLSFMESLKAKRKGEQTILAIHKDDFQIGHYHEIAIKELIAKEHNLFRALHDETFPNTYYDADTILNKLNAENKLFAANKDGKFLGYAYCEASLEYGEGNLHYLAVTPEARNQGTGRNLIQKCLDFMFSFNQIDEISLCVEADNQAAIHAYKRAGFKEKYNLEFYTVDLVKE